MEWMVYVNVQYEGGSLERYGDDSEAAKEAYQRYKSDPDYGPCRLIYGLIVEEED